MVNSPGTSLKRPGTQSASGAAGVNQSVRPMSSSGRPLSGMPCRALLMP
jgi:hypothetical protein